MKGFSSPNLIWKQSSPCLTPLSPGKRLALFFSGKSYQSLKFLERGSPFFFSGMSYHPIMYLLERNSPPIFLWKESSSYYVSPGKWLTKSFSVKSYHLLFYLWRFNLILRIKNIVLHRFVWKSDLQSISIALLSPASNVVMSCYVYLLQTKQSLYCLSTMYSTLLCTCFRHQGYRPRRSQLRCHQAPGRVQARQKLWSKKFEERDVKRTVARYGCSSPCSIGGYVYVRGRTTNISESVITRPKRFMTN